ncbi:MAG TPA: tetratricopeptide repeat protein, partial [Vicinamibacterales bacterium]|nr:tetratricopeptide repeat protein [Vicinamibacterales bacterium]
MRRALLGLFVTAVAIAGVAGYVAAAREREFRRLVAVGEAARARGETQTAVEAFSGAIALRPDAMLPYLRRGDIYRLRGDLQAALRDLRAAARLDPTAPRPLESLGDAHYALRRYDRAVAYFEAGLRLDDRSARLLYKLALAHYQGGRPGAAVEPLRRALALDPRFAEAHYLLGLALDAIGQRRAAAAALRRAVALEPGFVEARSELAAVFRALGRPADEIEQLEAIAALDPRPERHVALGLAHARAGRFDQAIAVLGRAAERAPDHPAAYVALGRLWLDAAETRGDHIALRKAIEALEQALGAGDDRSEVLTLFGRALYLSADYDLAEQVLREAATKRPVEPLALAYLADAAE